MSLAAAPEKRDWRGDGLNTDNFLSKGATPWPQPSTDPLRFATLPLNWPTPHHDQEVRDVTQQDINVLALVKGTERYIFLYDDKSRAETLRTLGRYASNPELSFTWYDAAILSQKVRQASQEQRQHARRFEMPAKFDD